MKKAIISFLLLWCTAIWAANVDTVHIADPATWAAGELKAYIGKTVVFDYPMVVCNNSGWSGLVISPRRIFAPTNQAYPRTAEYNQTISLNQAARIRLSGVSGYHRMGEKIEHLTAKVNNYNDLSWVSGTWQGNSRADLLAGIPKEELGDYRLLVCTMNLEYYLTIPNPDPTSTMGPHSKEEHLAQRTKTGKALAHIAADLYGFIEIEKGDQALREIAEDLHTHTGHSYSIISDGTSPSGTYTKAGFVYRSDKLEPVGAIQSVGTLVADRGKMQCFREKETGETFIFSVNHFKAKSGNGNGLDANQGDGQGSFNDRRKKEAEAVIVKYNRFNKQIKEKDALIMGDLNAYGKEDPITVFTLAGFTDLHRAFHADSSYSYTFDGQAGYLDHAISSYSLRKQVTGMVGFHINSDESDAYTYDKSDDRTMFRCSDHDPVLVGLRLDSTLSKEASNEVDAFAVVEDNEKFITVVNATSNGSADAFCRLYTLDGRPVYYSEYRTDDEGYGQLVNDDTHPIVSEISTFEAPVQSGVYILTIYTSDQKIVSRKVFVP